MRGKPKKLLLHTCCGVCGSWIAQDLNRDYQVTMYFYNPNIYPEEEYARRRDGARIVAESLGIPFIEGEYTPEGWSEGVRGLEHEPEGGDRCCVCFDYRLERTARYAKEHGFRYFATTLTIGRNKRADVINPIGKQWSKQYGVKFVEGDWKKRGGQNETDKKSQEMGLYRQNYCGCKYSIRSSKL